MASDRPDLQDLVENPQETLDVELKDWMDIRNDVVRANIASHLAALANYGRKARSIASAPATTPNREKEHDESHHFGCPHCVSADFRSFSAQRGSRPRRRRKDLLGTWTLVSITIEQDGKRTDLFGPNPQGQETRAANGHVSVIITRSDLPQFASNNRAAGTPEENTAVVQGSIAYFGMSSGNERDIVYCLLGYI